MQELILKDLTEKELQEKKEYFQKQLELAQNEMYLIDKELVTRFAAKVVKNCFKNKNNDNYIYVMEETPFLYEFICLNVQSYVISEKLIKINLDDYQEITKEEFINKLLETINHFTEDTRFSTTFPVPKEETND